MLPRMRLIFTSTKIINSVILIPTGKIFLDENLKGKTKLITCRNKKKKYYVDKQIRSD